MSLNVGRHTSQPFVFTGGFRGRDHAVMKETLEPAGELESGRSSGFAGTGHSHPPGRGFVFKPASGKSAASSALANPGCQPRRHASMSPMVHPVAQPS